MKKQQHFKIISIISLAIILAFTFTACGEDSDELVGFVWIPPDTFEIGEGSGIHSVTLTKGFYMSKYTITQGQYFAIMEYTPSYNPSGDGKGRLPVENINWYDAIVFCNKLSIKHGLQPVYSKSGSTNPDDWGPVPTISDTTWDAVEMIGPYPNVPNGYRLPTEAEWEYACRAGTTTAYNTGTDNIDLSQANYGGSAGINKTTEVGSYAPNAWGLYDMHGNVFEFCWDWDSQSNYYSNIPPLDPTGPPTSMTGYRVVRGGAWSSTDASILRSVNRTVNYPYNRSANVGLRVVRP